MAKKKTAKKSSQNGDKTTSLSVLDKDRPEYPYIEWVDPKTITAHPDNWRVHDRRQRAAYKALRKQVGDKWIDCPKYNLKLKRLYDGHMRVEEAIKAGEKFIPVMIHYLSEEEEANALLSMDTVGTMASPNTEALRKLTDRVRGTLEKATKTHKDAITRITRDVDAQVQRIETGRQKPQALPPSRPKREDEEDVEEDDTAASDPITVTLEDNVLFGNTNPFGIPELSDVFFDEPPDPVWDRTNVPEAENTLYCQSARPFPPERSGGLLCFFTEDYRFNRCYDDAVGFTSQLFEEDWSGVFMPDYSRYSNWPFALNLFQLYKSRWCGRYWQEVDIPIIPIIQTMGDPKKDHDIWLHTLPQSMPVVAMQCRTFQRTKRKTNFNFANRMIEASLSHIKCKHFVIYGGDEHKDGLVLPKRRGMKYHLFTAYTTQRRRLLKGETDG